jgi:hypothetical protein
MVVAGPLLTEMACALEGAVVAGGLSALGAGLYSLGLPKGRVIRYETAIQDGKFVLIAHGTPEEIADARAIIQRTGPESSEPHRA